MARKKPINYVDNKRLYQEICLYKDAQKKSIEEGKEAPRIPEYVGECILKIAQNLAKKPQFINYPYIDEMINDGIENCICYFDDFNPYYTNPNMPNYTPNPFAYFTQIVYFAFIRRINKEHKMRYTIYKSFSETFTNDGDLLVDGDDNHVIPVQMYDNINSFMTRFEEKEQRKKAKRTKDDGLMKFVEDAKNE